MAVFCEAVILGANNPFEVELISNFADASGVVVPIPVWAKPRLPINTITKYIF